MPQSCSCNFQKEGTIKVHEAYVIDISIFSESEVH
jgi:hypothetical protein